MAADTADIGDLGAWKIAAAIDCHRAAMVAASDCYKAVVQMRLCEMAGIKISERLNAMETIITVVFLLLTVDWRRAVRRIMYGCWPDCACVEDALLGGGSSIGVYMQPAADLRQKLAAAGGEVGRRS